MKKARMLISLPILLSIFFARADQDLSYQIDWAKGVVLARGTATMPVNNTGIPIDPDTGQTISLNRGRLITHDLAREASKEAIVRALKTLKIDKTVNFTDLINNDYDMRKRLTDLLENEILFQEEPAGHCSSRCIAKLNFSDIITAINPDQPKKEFSTSDEMALPTPYSSLIIDARGLNIKKMLFPSIFNEDGKEIFSKRNIDFNYAGQGIITYVYSEKQAFKHEKAGGHPYFSVALKSVYDSPVLGHHDVRKIFSHHKTISALQKCRVILIIEKEEKP